MAAGREDAGDATVQGQSRRLTDTLAADVLPADTPWAELMDFVQVRLLPAHGHATLLLKAARLPRDADARAVTAARDHIDGYLARARASPPESALPCRE